jgi:hypothetical protein
MKRVWFTTLLFSCLILPLPLSAQISSSQSKANQLVNLIRHDTSLSSEQKITQFNKLLQTENAKRDLNSPTILILKQAILTEMLKLGTYVEIKTLFETPNFLKGINKTNENINTYVRLLRSAINAYLMLQEYDNAKNLITELQPYFTLYDVTDVNIKME